MRIVTIGGGTGTFTVLSSLKTLPEVELKAIVTTSDDGGSTGRLRDAYGFLPMGDARQALVALSADAPVLRELFAYRFDKGELAGHNLGNLFLAALTSLRGSEAEAIKEASKILRVKGYVIPATDVPTVLSARLVDGTLMTGEHAITARENRSAIEALSLSEPASLSIPAKEAIGEADAIVLGPGTLYASTIAAMLADGTKEAIKASPAKLIYVMNLFTQRGHTENYPASKHLAEITAYAGREPDIVLVHTGAFSGDVLEWYAKEGEYPVADDLGERENVKRLPLASVQTVLPLPGDAIRRSLVRHDPRLLRDALASAITSA